jgi:plastocyanin
MTTRVIIVALTVLAFVAGCGGSKTSAPQQQTPAGLVVDITISNGTVTPANAELDAKVGQPITFRVTSDAADELHVHSVPDHEFEVEAKPNQTFQFSVDVPGQVEVELHKLDRTVATIQVQQ